MQETTPQNAKERFILTKSYEIAYALFRISPQIEDKDFAASLRKSGTALLSAAAEEDYSAASRSIQSMECLIKFAGDVNILGTANSDLILREIYALDAAITERKNSVKTDRFDLSEIFSHQEENFREEHSATEQPATNPTIHNIDTLPRQEVGREDSGNGTTPSKNNSNSLTVMNPVTPNSAIRQSAILEKIRQSGSCRLKDIEEILPECSERTIRYDLQSLAERNLVERVGNGGPSVYYRLPQVA